MATPKKSTQSEADTTDVATVLSIGLASAMSGAAVYIAMSRWCSGEPACAGFVAGHAVRPGHAARPGSTRDSDSMPACTADVHASWRLESDPASGPPVTVGDAHDPHTEPTPEQRATCTAAQQEVVEGTPETLGSALSAQKRLQQCDTGSGGRRAVWNDMQPSGDKYRSALALVTNTEYGGYGIEGKRPADQD